MINRKNNMTKAVVFLFALVMSFSALAVMAPSNEAADNEAPVWSVGDGVAVSMSVDLIDLYNSESENFSIAIEELLMDMDESAVELDDFSLTQASARAVVLLEVTEVTSTSYTIMQMAAFEVKFGASMTWKSDMPNTGNYANWSEAWNSTSNKTISATVSLVLGMSENVTLVLDKESMALQRVSIRVQPAIDLRVSGTGIPDMIENEDDEGNTTSVDVSYGTLNAKLVVNPAFTVSLAFDPYFNLFNLPNPDAVNWSTETENVTINAAFSGFIDIGVSGTLSQAVQANTMLGQVFDNVPAGVTGLNGFPINLAEVTIPASVFDENNTIGITNGALPEQVIPVPQLIMAGTGDMTSNLSGILDNFTVYGIWFEDEVEFDDPPEWGGVFYPEVTGMGTTSAPPYGIPYSATLLDLDNWSEIVDNVTADMEEDMVTMMSNMTGMNMTGSMTFSTISSAAANDIAASISQTIASIVPDPEDSGFDIVSFFLDSPYYGIIALVGVLVIVAVITRR